MRSYELASSSWQGGSAYAGCKAHAVLVACRMREQLKAEVSAACRGRLGVPFHRKFALPCPICINEVALLTLLQLCYF